MRELVRYAISMPVDPADTKTSYRYPFIAQEILKSGCGLVLDYFFPRKNCNSIPPEESLFQDLQSADYDFDAEALDLLILSLLESSHANDPVLSGYLCGILTSFSSHRKQALVSYFFSFPDLADLMLKNISDVSPLGIFLCSSSADPLDIDEAEDEEGKNKLFSFERVEVYKKIIILLRETSDPDTQAGCLHLLRQLSKGAFNLSPGEALIGQVLFQESLWDVLLNISLRTKLNPSISEKYVMKGCAELLQDILVLLDPSRICATPSDALAGLSVLSGIKLNRAKVFCSKLRTKYLDENSWVETWCGAFFSKLLNFLDSTSNGKFSLPKKINSVGVDVETIENHRLALFELVPRILYLGSPKAMNGFVTSGLLPSLLVS